MRGGTAPSAGARRALRLPLDPERIEEPSGVVADPEAEDPHARGERIQLDQGHLGAERIGDVGGLEGARALEPRLQAERGRARRASATGPTGARNEWVVSVGWKTRVLSSPGSTPSAAVAAPARRDRSA